MSGLTYWENESFVGETSEFTFCRLGFTAHNHIVSRRPKRCGVNAQGRMEKNERGVFGRNEVFSVVDIMGASQEPGFNGRV